MSTDAAKTGSLIDRLLKPEVFPHEVTRIELLETHISWVILTGPFAYKIKKPVKFDFVDYSSLERRQMFCRREFELNRRFARNLYLGVVPIVESDERLSVGIPGGNSEGTGQAKPIEYAVKMVQFPQRAIVASRMSCLELTSASVTRFGNLIADFHRSAEPVSADKPYVDVSRVITRAFQNFDVLGDVFADEARSRTLDILRRWTEYKLPQIEPLLQQRLDTGRVRRCHGDLHLKNVIQQNGDLQPFDGIEFSKELQCVDVMSEVAFTMMDFAARGRPGLGWRFINAYLEATGDYGGLSVLRFFLVYRSLVRAKVTWLNPNNHTEKVRRNNFEHLAYDDPLAGPWDKYLHAAQYFAMTLSPSLTITCGLSGSGKSTSAIRLAQHQGGIRIRSDVERCRLSDQSASVKKYSPEMTERIYEYLLSLARLGIKYRFPVIIDATFLEEKRRTEFHELAMSAHVPFRIINCEAPFKELCRRIKSRVSDPSEATIEVLKRQMQIHHPLTDEERQFIYSDD